MKGEKQKGSELLDEELNSRSPARPAGMLTIAPSKINMLLLLHQFLRIIRLFQLIYLCFFNRSIQK